MQRYNHPDQRYPPAENPRFAPRGRSPSRHPADRHPSGSYGPPPPRRDYSPPARDWQAQGSARGPGVPRGPKAAAFDAPRGRGGYPPPPASRGRGYVAPRGDYRAGFYEREPLNEPRGPEPRAEDRGWRQDGPERRDSFSRPPPPDYRDARDHPPREIRGPPLREGPAADDPYYDGMGNRGRGRGARSRDEWATRGRGRGLNRDDRGHAPSDNRSEFAWNRDAPLREPSYDSRDSRNFDTRERGRDDHTFDPFTQDRAAAARDGFNRPRPTSRGTSTPSTPASQNFPRPPIDSARPGPDRTRDDPDLRRVASLSRPQDDPRSRRESLRSDAVPPPPEPVRDRYMAGTSSPPRAPAVPQYGSIAPSQVSNTSRTAPPTDPRPPQAISKTPAVSTAPKFNATPSIPPSAPRADAERQPPPPPPPAPTAPRAPRAQEEPIPSQPRSTDYRQDATATRTSPTFQSTRTWAPPTQPAINRALGTSASPPTHPSVPVPSGPRGNTGSAAFQGANYPVPTAPKAIRGFQAPPQPPIARPPPVGPAAGGNWQRNFSQGAPAQQNARPLNSLPAKRDAYGQEKSRFPEAPRGPANGSHPHDARPHYDTPRDVDPKWQPGPAGISVPGSTSRHEAPRSPRPRSPAWGDEPPDFGVTCNDPADAQRQGVKAEEVPGALLEIAKPDLADAMELDEDDYQRAEESFQREKAKLEADLIDVSTRYLRGATPLERLSQLSYIALAPLPVEEEDDVPPLSDGEDDSSAKITAQTPEDFFVDIEDKYLIRREHSPLPVSTPQLQSLPFLSHGPLMEFSEMHEFMENEDRLRDGLSKIHLHFAANVKRNDKLQVRLHNQFANMYPRWMDMVERLDREHREQQLAIEDAEVLPPKMPLLDANPLLLPLTSGEPRRRGGAVSSDWDFAVALQASIVSGEQEKVQRERQAMGAKFDIRKECRVRLAPDDDDNEEVIDFAIDGQFGDEDSLTQMALEPLADNFTVEEHRAMLDEFEREPKKWGKLAGAVGPHRNFKQCIVHYYSSKWAGEFKVQRFKPKGRFGKGKPRAGRGRTGALMSNLGDSNHSDTYDVSEFMLAVTDSGRPRRAAAPTFNNKETEETPQAASALAGKKKTGSAQEEKVGRRIKAGSKDKVPRRPKPQLLARRASMSPAKTDVGYGPAPTFANDVAMEGDQIYGMRNWPPTEQMDYEQVQLARYPPEHGAPVQAANQPRKALMSSYWSGSEVSLFEQLIGTYSQDWNTIAQLMRTKTAVMCKNFWSRKYANANAPRAPGEDSTAEERAARGEKPRMPVSPMSTTASLPQGTLNMLGQRPLAHPDDAGSVAHASPPRHRELERYPPERPRDVQTTSVPSDFHGQSQGLDRPLFTHGPASADNHTHETPRGVDTLAPRGFAGPSPQLSRAHPAPIYTSSWEDHRQVPASHMYQATHQDRFLPPSSSFVGRGPQATAGAPRAHEEQRQSYYQSRNNETEFDQQRRNVLGDRLPAQPPNYPLAEQRSLPQERSWPTQLSRPASPKIERPPSAPSAPLAPVAPPAPPAHRPRQSNLLALLNTDEPSPRPPPPRTVTPPQPSLSVPPQPPRPLSQPPRYEASADMLRSASRNADRAPPTSHEMLAPTTTGEPLKRDWSSRVGYQPTAQRQPSWMDNPGRGNPLDQHRSALAALDGRHAPSPPQGTLAYNPPTYATWSQSLAPRTESPSGYPLSRPGMQGPPNAEHGMRDANLVAYGRSPDTRDHPSMLYRGERHEEQHHHSQPQQQPQRPPPPPLRSETSRPSTERLDAWMMHGSGYKSNTAKRDLNIEESRSRQQEQQQEQQQQQQQQQHHRAPPQPPPPREYVRYDPPDEADRRGREMDGLRMDRERDRERDRDRERIGSGNPFFQSSQQQQQQQQQQHYSEQQQHMDQHGQHGQHSSQHRPQGYAPEIHRPLGFGPVGPQQSAPPPQPPQRR